MLINEYSSENKTKIFTVTPNIDQTGIVLDLSREVEISQQMNVLFRCRWLKWNSAINTQSRIFIVFEWIRC